jgi:hypothetical protein
MTAGRKREREGAKEDSTEPRRIAGEKAAGERRRRRGRHVGTGYCLESERAGMGRQENICEKRSLSPVFHKENRPVFLVRPVFSKNRPVF